ncbi:LytTR family transcriptional regulator DNA-binding domain-containing protein [Chitinophaga pollutisoli]|uniref:LytTR family transcriptional regulator DNA-binding domain-containing protein n=1 Tax=Chitinophaga pollutisoli TaxID=3133966 RepID=A0ABZ2YVQ5_9BACT
MATQLLKEQPLRWTFLIACCLFSAVHGFIMRYWLGVDGTIAWMDANIHNILLFIAVAAITQMQAYYRPVRMRYLYVVVLTTVITILWLMLTLVILRNVFPKDVVYLQWLSDTAPVRFALGWLLLTGAGYLSFILYEMEEQRQALARKDAAEKMAREAELYKLRQQLQPHFLFNSLNSINALVSIRPEEARMMIQQLSDFLRGTLKREDQIWIPLREELQYLQLYLDIEKVRFRHRLTTEIETAPGVGNSASRPCSCSPPWKTPSNSGCTTPPTRSVSASAPGPNATCSSFPSPIHSITSCRRPRPKAPVSASIPSAAGCTCSSPGRTCWKRRPKATYSPPSLKYRNSMIKTILIDDEPLARELVREYLRDFPQVDVVAECNDGFEGLKAIQQHQPDLLFLDIQMPKINGFEMLELVDKLPQVIFTTAFEEYALRAFEVSAVDYLLKPFSKDRFAKALQKMLERRSEVAPELLDNAAREMPMQQNRVVVKINGKIKIIPVQDIHYLEAADDYVKIVTAEGSFLKNKTMAYFEKMLDPQQFIRVHRSYILSITQITRIDPYEKESYLAILRDGSKVMVSKTGYPKLKEVLGL